MTKKQIAIRDRRRRALKDPFTKERYRLLVRQAKVIAKVFTGDKRYEKRDVNFVAAESMLMGWLSCQGWFQKWANEYSEIWNETDLWLITTDWATQAMSDATMKMVEYP